MCCSRVCRVRRTMLSNDPNVLYWRKSKYYYGDAAVYTSRGKITMLGQPNRTTEKAVIGVCDCIVYESDSPLLMLPMNLIDPIFVYLWQSPHDFLNFARTNHKMWWR